MSLVFRATYYLLEAISYLLLARIILSWIPQVKQSKFYGFIFQVTEPLLVPVRKLISKTKAALWPIDVSVIIIFILIGIIQMIIARFAF
ncbi:MAG: YggT family protein [Clostridiales bacterium]|nr:YggT family protein [Clostridiales bacterium]